MLLDLYHKEEFLKLEKFFRNYFQIHRNFSHRPKFLDFSVYTSSYLKQIDFDKDKFLRNTFSGFFVNKKFANFFDLENMTDPNMRKIYDHFRFYLHFFFKDADKDTYFMEDNVIGDSALASATFHYESTEIVKREWRHRRLMGLGSESDFM